MNGFLTHQQVSHYLSESCSVMSESFQLHGLYSPWNSPGQNTEVGSHSLLQGIFLTQGLNPSLSHCRPTLYCLSYQGSPEKRQSPIYFMNGGYVSLNMPPLKLKISHSTRLNEFQFGLFIEETVIWGPGIHQSKWTNSETICR